MAKRRRSNGRNRGAPPRGGAPRPLAPPSPPLSTLDIAAFGVGALVAIGSIVAWLLWRSGAVSAHAAAVVVLVACGVAAAFALGVFLLAGPRTRERLPVVSPLFLMAFPAGAALAQLTNRPTGFALSATVALIATGLWASGRARPRRA